MNITDASETLAQVLHRIAPDISFAEVPDDAVLRDELELDSLDFLAFVEQLSKATGVRIEEADYPKLETKASCLEFLAAA